MMEGIAIKFQSVDVKKGTTYENALGGEMYEHNYLIRNITWTIDEVVDKIYKRLL